jgi:hypothetical protein
VTFSGENQVLYFAYGSNLWLEQMQRRCPDHRLIGLGCLEGYRWFITSRGYASILLMPGNYVLGIVYELSVNDEISLDICEGVEQGKYYKQQLPVLIAGIEKPCMTYIDFVIEEGVPHSEYILRINKGIRDAGLPKQYVEQYLSSYLPVIDL